MSEELLPPGYPTMWETHAVLSDGSPVELRPVRPADRALIEVFHKRQSPESIYFRFFQHRPELSDKELDYFTTIDYEARMAFVALVGGELVAVARYESSPYDPRPEVAFFVDDANHGRGLATVLLEHLAVRAREVGLSGFTASVLPENRRMIGRNNWRGESDETAGAVRAGKGLLAGLLRCGRCGRKLYVRYWGKSGTSARYLCTGDFGADGGRYCIGFGGATVDRRFGDEIVRVLSPLGVRASVEAFDRLGAQQCGDSQPCAKHVIQALLLGTVILAVTSDSHAQRIVVEG